jgi:uncharacterized protein involved in type VI secretion and phage assembly
MSKVSYQKPASFRPPRLAFLKMENFFDIVGSRSERTPVFAQPRMGIVTSSNPQTGTAKVLIQPEGVLTGWLPVLTQWVGSGWGISCPPSPGDQVLIIPQEGDAQHGLIVGRLFSNSVRPPQAEAGEITITHQSGCSIRLVNSGIIMIEGDLHVSGDVYDTHGSLSKLRNDYNAHMHYTNNGQDTSAPLSQD